MEKMPEEDDVQIYSDYDPSYEIEFPYSKEQKDPTTQKK